MISFELFFEKCQAPVDVLAKYKDDPDVFISFTNIIEPRAGKEGEGDTANKQTKRIGLNPLTSYDTPAGVYTYPLNSFWDNIRNYSIPFVKDMPYVYIIKPKRPERCARVSTYTEEDFKRDSEELMEMYPQYHLEDIINNEQDVASKYPEYSGHQSLSIKSTYRNPPLRFFWSLTRTLGYLILNDIEKKQETKTKHITIWTHIMRQFYDGIIDDTGSGTIHSNEPWQAVFWNSSYFKVIDHIDRLCNHKNNRDRSHAEWTGRKSSPLKEHKILRLIQDTFLNDKEDSLNSGLLKYLKNSGIYDTYKKIKKGDIYPFTVNYDGVFDDYPDAYKELAIQLYLTHKKSDERIFDDSNLPSNTTFLYAHNDKIIPLLKLKKSERSANTLLHSVFTNLLTKELEPHILQLLQILKNNESDMYSSDYRYMVGNIITTALNQDDLYKFPRILNVLTLMFFNLKTDYNSSFKSIGYVLMLAVAKTKTKNQAVWRRFFPYFSDPETNGTSKANSLEVFINAKTGLDDELRDYINSHTSPNERYYKNVHNDVWQKYFGVDLYRPDLSQFDAIKKSKHTPSEKINSKFQVGDIVASGYDHSRYGEVIKINFYSPHVFDYTVTWDDGPTSTQQEYELLSNNDLQKLKWKVNAIVEDENGDIYKIVDVFYISGEIEVKSLDGEYLDMKMKDVIPYDPKTSNHKGKFSVDEEVYSKIDGKTGKILSYNPFNKNYPYYIKIGSYNDSYKESALVKLSKPLHTVGETFKDYKYDVIYKIIDLDGYEYTVEYGPDSEHYDNLKSTNTYVTMKFDEKVTGHNFIKDNFGENFEYKPKYKVGDIILEPNSTDSNKLTKYVIRSIDKKSKEYFYDIYVKPVDGSTDWILTKNFYNYGYEDFDESAEPISVETIDDKANKNNEVNESTIHNPGDTYTYTLFGGGEMTLTITDIDYTKNKYQYFVQPANGEKEGLWWDDFDVLETMLKNVMAKKGPVDPAYVEKGSNAPPIQEEFGNYPIGQVFEHASKTVRMVIVDIINGEYVIQFFDESGDLKNEKKEPIKEFEKGMGSLIKSKVFTDEGCDLAYIKI